MAKEGVLSGLTDFKIAGLPLGTVAGGAVAGGVGDALAGVVSGFAPQFPSWAIKFAAAWGLMQWGGKLLGKDIAQIGGLFLTYDGVQELVNIRGSVSNVIGGMTGKLVKQSPPVLTGAKGSPATASNSYYPSIGRRAG